MRGADRGSGRQRSRRPGESGHNATLTARWPAPFIGLVACLMGGALTLSACGGDASADNASKRPASLTSGAGSSSPAPSSSSPTPSGSPSAGASATASPTTPGTTSSPSTPGGSASATASGDTPRAGTATGGASRAPTTQKPPATKAPGASTSHPKPTPAAPRSRTWWRPGLGLSWQWQLEGSIDTSVRAGVFDLDADVAGSVVGQLRARGSRVICYISAGSVESWRSDAGRFPAAVQGKALDGWAGERWLDVRQRQVLGPIMAARMDKCRAKGFDAVEADNVDGYDNDSGFAISSADQIAYNKMLATLAHSRGLAIGLKNDLAQVAALEPYFDFAVNEQCAEYDECDLLRPFLSAKKAVFHAEYDVATTEFCPVSKSLGLSSIRKHLALDAWRQTC